MQINLKTLGVTATMATGLLVGSASAYAENGGELKSNAIINFEPTTEPTKPVNPIKPGEPATPVDPTKPDGKPTEGTAGPLSIDYASSLNFGTQKISSTDQTYQAAAQKFIEGDEKTEVEGPNFVQVTDNRGTEAGWTLGVKQDGQFKSETGKELTGAQIAFKNAVVSTDSASPKPSIVERSFSLKLTPEGNGVAQNIMSAKVKEGAGTHLLVFGDKEGENTGIELSVPGKTTKYAEKYATSLIWTLTDVPGTETDK